MNEIEKMLTNSNYHTLKTTIVLQLVKQWIKTQVMKIF